ncbi:MAG: pseudouridine synthase [Capnocytophaga sp.]|nr:pseudouridine synthase [Capnocytophaga sp.]
MEKQYRNPRGNSASRNNQSDDSKKSFQNNKSNNNSERKSYQRSNDDRPFRRQNDSPYRKNEGFSSDRNKNNKPYRKPSEGASYNSDKPRYSDDRQRTFDKPYRKPSEGASYNSDKPRYSDDRQRTFDKPYRRPSEGASYNSDKPRYNDDRQRTFDKPYRKPFGNDRKPYDKGERRPYRKYDESPREQAPTYDIPEAKETRLNKYIANAGICSRRNADTYITAGSVEVNGEVITQMGYRVKPGDVVKFDGKTISSEKKVYILLNKPKGFITTTQDEKGRKTVMDLVANATSARILPVGRLDRPTTGLLLLTNDGDMAKKLTHPSHGVRKIYHVVLDRKIDHKDFVQIEDGIELEDGFIQVDEISYINNAPKNELGVKIHSGRNRIVRRIFESLGYTIEKLDRVVFAGLTKKDLPRGHWRHLTPQEVINLRNSKL